MTATTYTLSRTGHRPLTFDGERLASIDGQYTAGKEQNRWHELAVYRTAGGSYVVAVVLRTRWQGEHDHHVVEHATDPAAIEDALLRYDPCPAGIGYPSGGSYEDKQSRLAADLRRRYEALVTELFERLGDDFAEVLA